MAKLARNTQRSLITATEVGEFVYCAKAWQLKRDGISAHSPHLEPGRIYHAEHGEQLALAGRLRQAGLACAFVAAALLLGCLAWYFART